MTYREREIPQIVECSISTVKHFSLRVGLQDGGKSSDNNSI